MYLLQNNPQFYEEKKFKDFSSGTTFPMLGAAKVGSTTQKFGQKNDSISNFFQEINFPWRNDPRF